MRPGHLVWVRLPAPPGGGTEVRRPAVALQDGELGALLPTVLVVPLTLDLDALKYPGTLAVEPDAENGLAEPLVALLFQLTAVDVTTVEPTRGRLSARTLRALFAELDRLMGRPRADG